VPNVRLFGGLVAALSNELPLVRARKPNKEMVASININSGAAPKSRLAPTDIAGDRGTTIDIRQVCDQPLE
jgi:hypothetical protein